MGLTATNSQTFGSEQHTSSHITVGQNIVSHMTVAGIPTMEFIENVGEFLTEKYPGKINPNIVGDIAVEKVELEKVVRDIEEMHLKYKFLEKDLRGKKNTLEQKLTEISSALEFVQLDKRMQGSTVDLSYNMCDNVWAKARVEMNDKVCLWLGANVMLEFTLDEAIELLTKNEETAKTTLGELDKELGFVRDQMTVSEVNMAIVYNWGVVRRQKNTDGGAPSPGP